VGDGIRPGHVTLCISTHSVKPVNSESCRKHPIQIDVQKQKKTLFYYILVVYPFKQHTMN